MLKDCLAWLSMLWFCFLDMVQLLFSDDLVENARKLAILILPEVYIKLKEK